MLFLVIIYNLIVCMPLLLILENYDGPGWVGEAKGNRRSDRGRGQVKDVYKWGACGSWCLYFFNPLTLKTVHKRLVVVILVVGDCVFYVYTYLRSCQVLLRQISPKVSKQWAVMSRTRNAQLSQDTFVSFFQIYSIASTFFSDAPFFIACQGRRRGTKF